MNSFPGDAGIAGNGVCKHSDNGCHSVSPGLTSARLLHFFCMSGIVLFVLVHVIMVILVPKTFLTMITGKLKHG